MQPKQEQPPHTASTTTTTQVKIQEGTEQKQLMELGYWAFRGKAQLPRLLLYYLNMPYKEKLYHSPTQWYQLKIREEARWRGIDLPYLKDGEILITDPIPIMTYLIRKAGRSDMLGRTIEDEAIIDMFAWSTANMAVKVLCLSWRRPTDTPIGNLDRAQIWKSEVQPKLRKIQSCSHFRTDSDWYMGYLTPIDFIIYQLMEFVRQQFGGIEKVYPKMSAVWKNISELEAIKRYYNTPGAVREFTPEKMLIRPYNNLPERL